MFDILSSRTDALGDSVSSSHHRGPAVRRGRGTKTNALGKGGDKDPLLLGKEVQTSYR